MPACGRRLTGTGSGPITCGRASKAADRSRTLPAHLAHAFLNESAGAIHARWPPLERRWKKGGEPRGLLSIEAAGCGLVVIMRSRVCAVDAGSPLDDVEIELKDALLAEDDFGNGDESGFGAFAQDGPAGSEEDIFDELLGDGGGSASAGALQVVFGSDLDLVPIEAMVLIETGVFRGDDCMLEFG